MYLNKSTGDTFPGGCSSKVSHVVSWVSKVLKTWNVD